MKKEKHDPVLSGAWYAAVVHRKATCLVCGGRWALQGHHLVSQQALRSFCRSLRMDRAGTQRILWDVRNGAACCEQDHVRHTTAFRRIPFASLPASVFEFAEELDAMTDRHEIVERLRREYP